MGLYQIVLTKHHHNIIVYTNNDLKLRNKLQGPMHQ